MKKISLLLSIAILVGIVFYALSSISRDNQYTSVRQYSAPKIAGTGTLTPSTTDTEPPIIDILNYKNKDIITTSTIDISVIATDNMTASGDLVITGVGTRTLTPGYNTITVSAKDAAGNIGVKYIIIEKK